jgi:Domain of unknown function (DUF4190)
MKQCPVCEKTFDDSLRFCQVDGTPLVDKAETVDPYKTMVASKEEIAAAMRKSPDETKPEVPEPAVPAPLENELLEIPPAADPNKTQVVTEEELRAEMARMSDDEDSVIDVPPVASEPSSSSQPSTPPSPFGDSPSTPPSPFAAPSAEKEEPGPANFPTTPPIPSPFNAKQADSTSEHETPSAAPFATSSEAEEPLKPFEQPAQAAPMAQAEFNPPAQSNMQNPQNFGQPPAPAGQNKTLSIISLILGIAGLTICCGTFLPSLLGVILGFMGRSKANSNPSEYGGAGLALGGIITGAIGLIGGVIAWIVYFFWLAAFMANMPR